ncbi:50S ribosomal protein L19 [Treponema sp. HNW]|uniref:50S ribosomal protein L19 n=1 Tax=Treponema sp. HNW TaxID=3116654 RepID=UPI003D133698
MDLIKTIEESQKREVASFKVGDTVKVHFKIIEGKTERVQVYEGLVLCFKNSGARRTFTVRKNSYGVGVERVFPLYSPRIAKVEVMRPGRVRRSKLYYIRGKVGKAAKIRELIVKKADKAAAKVAPTAVEKTAEN